MSSPPLQPQSTTTPPYSSSSPKTSSSHRYSHPTHLHITSTPISSRHPHHIDTHIPHILFPLILTTTFSTVCHNLILTTTITSSTYNAITLSHHICRDASDSSPPTSDRPTDHQQNQHHSHKHRPTNHPATQPNKNQTPPAICHKDQCYFGGQLLAVSLLFVLFCCWSLFLFCFCLTAPFWALGYAHPSPGWCRVRRTNLNMV